MLFLANAGWTAMSGSVFVSVTIGDPMLDEDEDGIDDDWEMDQFGNKTTATSTSDYDEDGFPDLSEYLAGTDPKNLNSLLRIEKVEIVPPDQLRITWQSSTNNVPAPRSYDIYYADTAEDVCDGGTVLQFNVPTEGAQSDVEDTFSGSRRRFYRVRLHR